MQWYGSVGLCFEIIYASLKVRLWSKKQLMEGSKKKNSTRQKRNDCVKIVGKRKKKIDPARIRTWNPLIRSQMPYPLGHRAVPLGFLNPLVFIL